jgi:hypothetical protein
MQDVVACRPTYPLLLVLEGDGRDAAVLREHLGRAALSDRETRALRGLFARERVAERAGAAAERAVAHALECLGALPASEPRAGLERITRALAAPASA